MSSEEDIISIISILLFKFMIDENFCAKLLKRIWGKEWKLLGEVLAGVKVKIAKLIWKEFNCLFAVKWSIWWTYGGNSDGGDLIGVIVIRVLI